MKCDNLMMTVMLLFVQLSMSAHSQVFAFGLSDPINLASVKYWETHRIGIARITKVGPHPDDAEFYDLEVTRWIESEPIAEPENRPMFQYSRGIGEDVPQLEENDCIVVFIQKDHPNWVNVHKVPAVPAESPFVQRVSRIARLHENHGGIEALSAGSFDEDAIVSLYCLNRLWAVTPSLDQQYLRRLRELQQNDAVDTRVRCMASKLANKLDGGYEHGEFEYLWVRRTIEGSKAKEPMPLIAYLLEFTNNRARNAAFLSRLAKDDEFDRPTRDAVIAGLGNSKLFDIANLDDVSEQIFESVLWLIQHRDPELRLKGSRLIANLCARLPILSPRQLKSREYLARSKEGIAAALAVETDKTCAFHMEQISAQLDRTTKRMTDADAQKR